MMSVDYILINYLLLITRLAYGLFEYCDHHLYLNATQKIYINSPFYPNKYPPGSSCRYKISAPINYKLSLNCKIDFDKDISSCTTEIFFLNREGNADLTGSEYFCGTGNFIRKSILNKAVISYVSTSTQYAQASGSFSCLIEVIDEPCDCGWGKNARIAGGVEANLNEFPSMVGIVHLIYQKIFCGGVIISNRYILSAAHCFITNETNNTNYLAALVGDYDLTTLNEAPSARLYQIEQIILHEYFYSQTVANDIALIKTIDTIKWDIGIAPACLPYKYLGKNFVGMKLDTAGWGTKSFGGEQTLKLLKTQLNVINQDRCRQRVPQLSSSQLCTFTPGSDTCQFDSGGGLYLQDNNRFYAIGIISFGFSCATALPSVNTKISSFIPWIQRNAYDSKFCIK